MVLSRDPTHEYHRLPARLDRTTDFGAYKYVAILRFSKDAPWPTPFASKSTALLRGVLREPQDGYDRSCHRCEWRCHRTPHQDAQDYRCPITEPFTLMPTTSYSILSLSTLAPVTASAGEYARCPANSHQSRPRCARLPHPRRDQHAHKGLHYGYFGEMQPGREPYAPSSAGGAVAVIYALVARQGMARPASCRSYNARTVSISSAGRTRASHCR